MNAIKENSTVGEFTVQSLIKKNEYTESYKVVDKDGKSYFLKLYVLARTPDKLVHTEDHEVLEVLALRKLRDVSKVSYVTHGTVDSAYGECPYVVTNYINGEVLADRLIRKGCLNEEEARAIFAEILNELKRIHQTGICHNNITPDNVMISDDPEEGSVLIDMGHASEPCVGKIPFVTHDLDIRYCRNSTSVCFFDENSDLFSAFAVFHTMLTGQAPWEIDNVSGDFATKMHQMKLFRFHKPLDFADLEVSEGTKHLLSEGLQLPKCSGYSSAEDALNDLEKSTSGFKEDKNACAPAPSGVQTLNKPNAKQEVDAIVQNSIGKGFEGIAGMQDLKNLVQQKVIFVIENKELAKQYGLTPPNGMLLYGPPGCGKTFFAEKFAEETAFNYILVKPSDLASVYIHGTQEKIRDLFKKAEKNAPTVLCFDEFDAAVPNRSAFGSENTKSEVNEFLCQLNNCSKRGIFVIATTNKPFMIDPAVLRTGRIDKHIFVPLPDKEARREMLNIHLKGRPYNEEAIDFETLASMTNGYIASDISYVVNNAAMIAAFTRSEITQELLECSIRETRPSISKALVEEYDRLREQMEGVEQANHCLEIGYKLR